MRHAGEVEMELIIPPEGHQGSEFPVDHRPSEEGGVGTAGDVDED